MNLLNQVYRLKKLIVRNPDIYLGENIEKVLMEGGRIAWSTTCVNNLKV